MNGSDPDGDQLTFSVVDFPENGSLSGTPPDMTYTPTPNFHGTDTFTFTAEDGYAVSEPTVVTIEVLPVNDPPAARDDMAAADTAPVLIENVLANDSDIDGDELVIAGFTQPLHGEIEAGGDDYLLRVQKQANQSHVLKLKFQG